MPNNIMVTISELQSSADKIAQACEQYQAAANSLKSAADELAGTWEGDSQVAFVNEYVAQMKAAAAKYQETDASAAQTIRAK